MNEKWTAGLIVVLCLLTFTAGVLLGAGAEKASYKRGQIDAINGDIRYELVTQPNGETKWEMKK